MQHKPGSAGGATANETNLPWAMPAGQIDPFKEGGHDPPPAPGAPARAVRDV
jgi:hypothetical protein